MPREAYYFFLGIALTSLVYVFYLPAPQITDFKHDKKLLRIDSIKKVIDAKNDSLKGVIDSIWDLPKETELVYINLNEKINSHYATTDTFTNADSLTNIIKRSIHSGRIESNPQLPD